MYDPKFEKAVQHKMEELEFRPSESVWVNIERAVSGQRRRRVIPFFWRLLIPALLVAIAGGAYYFGERAGRKAAAPAEIAGTPATHAIPAASLSKMTPTDKEAVTRPSRKEAAVVAAPKTQHTRTVTVNEDFGVLATVEPKQKFADEPGTSAIRNVRIGAYLYTPGLQVQRFAGGVQGAALKTNKNLISLSSLSRVRRPWAAGFVAGAGIDRLNRWNTSQAGGSAYYMAPALNGLSRMPAGKNSVSDVRPGVSFYAGVYLQKQVSDRWVFHTGLDLHYYSTQVSVGQQVSVIASPSTSLLSQTALTAAPASLVYAVGDQQTYTNHYYMLELPVSMQFRINRSKLLPLFLEGGGSVSRVMGTDALFYNPLTSLYLKNENVLNKTQFNVTSALLVGLPFHGIRIQAGPEVQYGLTPLTNVQGLGDQHFFYTGIRLVVLPGRK